MRASNKSFLSQSRSVSQRPASHRAAGSRQRHVSRDGRPVAAFRQRGTSAGAQVEDFNAPETWHEPRENGKTRYIVAPAGTGFVHAVTVEEIRERLASLSARFTRNLEVVQLSAMTHKRRAFPCYGMQWGSAVYLYPIEVSLIESYYRPPKPQQEIEARMYGGKWSKNGKLWTLTWTAESIRDFYLNNVLIHEIGHLNDPRNTNSNDRERFANWFAIEYGYRATR